MRKEHRLALAIVALAAAGCRQNTSSPDTTLDVPGKSSSIPSIPTPDFSAPVPSPYPTATLTPPPTIEFSPTPEVELINPYKGKVWNQRCRWDIDPATGQRSVRSCAEDWASLPLPGGCLDKTRVDLSPAACNLASTTFVLNELVPPEVFLKIIGYPGITPEILVNRIYPNLPNNKGILMSCKGAGAEVIIPTLKFFSLRVRTVNISEYSAVGLVGNLQPNQLAMFSFTGNKSWTGFPGFKHWSVASGVATYQGRQVVTYHDSFYYPDDDPFHPADPNHVIFELSPDLRDDDSYMGKSIRFVGGMVVSTPDNSGLPIREVTGGLLQLDINLLPPEAIARINDGDVAVAAAIDEEHGWHGRTSISDIFGYDGRPAIHGTGYDVLTMGEFHHNTDALPGRNFVVDTGYLPDGYGNYVIIRNETTGIEVLYAHMERVYVQTGQIIDRETIIGTTGKSGYGATSGNHGGYHTHMEIFYNGEAIKMNWWSNP